MVLLYGHACTYVRVRAQGQAGITWQTATDHGRIVSEWMDRRCACRCVVVAGSSDPQSMDDVTTPSSSLKSSLSLVSFLPLPASLPPHATFCSAPSSYAPLSPTVDAGVSVCHGCSREQEAS